MTVIDQVAGTPDEDYAARHGAGGRQFRWVLLGIAVLGLMTAMGVGTFESSDVYVMNTVLLACIGASALNMLMGTAGLVSMGSAAFLAVGAFGTVFLQSHDVPAVVAVLVSALASSAIGLVVGLPALRLRGLELALASIAGFFIVLFVCQKYQNATVGVSGFIFDGWFFDRELVEAQKAWAWLLFAVTSAVLVVSHLTISRKFGRTLRLIRDNELAATALGYRVTLYKMTIFAISSGLIGLQGALTANFAGVVSVEDFNLLLSIVYLEMILIGGADSLLGSVLGASIVISLPSLTERVVSAVSSSPSAAVASAQIALILSGVFVIAFVVLSSNGVVGALTVHTQQVANPLDLAPQDLTHLAWMLQTRRSRLARAKP